MFVELLKLIFYGIYWCVIEEVCYLIQKECWIIDMFELVMMVYKLVIVFEVIEQDYWIVQKYEQVVCLFKMLIYQLMWIMVEKGCFCYDDWLDVLVIVVGYFFEVMV